MACSKAFVLGVSGAVLMSLHGCGSGGSSGGGDGGGGGGGAGGQTTDSPPRTTPSATTPHSVVPTRTTTTTTTDVCAGKPTVPSGQDELVDALNQAFMGFDAADPNSPTGVTIRVADNFEFFCGGACSGWPDCRVSASLYNGKMMYNHDDHHLAVTMSRDAGILFNQTAVEGSMGKCAYFYDAATFGRVNRGCGCAALEAGCARESAWGNQDCVYDDPVLRHGLHPETCHDNTESSPHVDHCWCKSPDRNSNTPAPEHQTTTSQQCFYRLGGLYLPNGVLESEMHEMVVGRIANQENPPTERLADNTIRYKSEYWNEIVIDGEEMRRLLHVNPTHAVTAFVYVEGRGAGKRKALAMQQKALDDYGPPRIPIIGLDPHLDTRCSGPFRVASEMPTTTPRVTTSTWDGHSCVGEHHQCGGATWAGSTCCNPGLTCVERNPWYHECAPESDVILA